MNVPAGTFAPLNTIVLRAPMDGNCIRAELSECQLCAAVVLTESAGAHLEWHEQEKEFHLSILRSLS